MKSPLDRLRFRILILFLGTGLYLLSGCSLFKSEASKELEKTPQSLLMEGMEAYQRNKFSQAIEAFQKLKDRFPYNQYAIVAEIKLADSYYLNKDYELAATAYKEFEKMHPTNEIIPYVIFQTGMCYFQIMPTVDRDQTNAQLAVNEFERLNKNYPRNEYKDQALAKLILAKKNLALHDFFIGEFYFQQGKYDAALGRYEEILAKYPEISLPPKMEDHLKTSRERVNKARAEKK